MSEVRNIYVAGEWRPGAAVGTFRSHDPASGRPLEDRYPVSSREDVQAALEAGKSAAEELLRLPDDRRAEFLERFAERLEARAEEITAMAHRETGLPVRPRLLEVELPRTTNQLREAAKAVRESSWCLPVIDTRANIRSRFGPLGGPVAVFGPNNFPLAFNSASGGDFAAAIAAGNPVIAKANTSHPGTTRLIAEEAVAAVEECGLPRSTVQLLYRLDHEDGKYMVSHPLVAATGYTGSRAAGLELKKAADAAGKPIYLELSSINPVFILPGALAERCAEIVEEYLNSLLLGCGQFCTNPGIAVLLEGPEAGAFLDRTLRAIQSRDPGVLLSAGVLERLEASVAALVKAGAELLTGGRRAAGPGYRFENTLLRAPAKRFIEDPEALECEAFGNAGLILFAVSEDEMGEVARKISGNLTGTIYSDRGGADDALAARIAFYLRRRVGRLLNDKMPTGVAVSPAMNHGGPYPATGHPGFTSVGIPAAIRRFAMLECYDNVREDRLPLELRNRNAKGIERYVDGEWTRADAGA